MALGGIVTQMCDQMKNSVEICKNLSNLKSDEEIFSMTYEICAEQLSRLDFESRRKCRETSGQVRKRGNEAFAKNLQWEALKVYNESIAYAPKASEELAFSLGNRAACLLRLGYPEEALGDVETALNLPVSPEYKKKLESRKEKCIHSLEVGARECPGRANVLMGSGQLVDISQNQSSFFDSASESVQLDVDGHYERLLVAKENIKTGQVLIVEKPYSSVLLPDSLYTHCANCFKRSVNLIPCLYCSAAMFCCEKCMALSNKRFHKVECCILNLLVGLGVERMQLLSLRILIDAAKQGEALEKLQTQILEMTSHKENNYCHYYASLDFGNIYHLVTNTDKRSTSDLLYRSAVAVVLIVLLEKKTTFFSNIDENRKSLLKTFSGGLLLHFIQSLPCNAHEVSEFCENGLREIGAGAYATLSLINHSCDPNVVRQSCGDVIVLRAIRPIQKGHQIFDNYGYHYATHTFKERQNALMKQYYFICRCTPCTEHWPLYEDLPDKEPTPNKQMDVVAYKKLTQEFEENLIKIFQGSFDHEMIEVNQRYLDFLDEFVKRPWKNYNKCQEAIKHCMSFLGNHFRFSKGVFSD